MELASARMIAPAPDVANVVEVRVSIANKAELGSEVFAQTAASSPRSQDGDAEQMVEEVEEGTATDGMGGQVMREFNKIAVMPWKGPGPVDGYIDLEIGDKLRAEDHPVLELCLRI